MNEPALKKQRVNQNSNDNQNQSTSTSLRSNPNSNPNSNNIDEIMQLIFQQQHLNEKRKMNLTTMSPVYYSNKSGEMMPVSAHCIICQKELANFKFSISQRKQKPRDQRTCKQCVFERNRQHSSNKEFVTEFSAKKSTDSFNFCDICYVNFKQLSNTLCDSYINAQFRKYKISAIISLDIMTLICDYYNNQNDKNFIFEFNDIPNYFTDSGWKPMDGKVLNWISDKRKECYDIDVSPHIDKTICLPLKRIGLKFKIFSVDSWNTWSIYVLQWNDTLPCDYIHKTATPRDSQQVDLYQNNFHTSWSNDDNPHITVPIKQYDHLIYIFDFNIGKLDIWLNEKKKLDTMDIDINLHYSLKVRLYDRTDGESYINCMAISN